MTIIASAADNSQPRDSVFLRKVPWSEQGSWLKADTHIHTKFSDGGSALGDIVQRAIQHGCDVIAITDHADSDLSAATPEYLDAIKAAREKHPDRIIIAGLEWNVPPWDGREHAVVLFPPSLDERTVLPQFKARFDDLGRDTHDPALAHEALRWLAQNDAGNGVKPLVSYEHPNRKRSLPLEFVREFTELAATSDCLRIFAGAPGHQRSIPLGSYYFGPITTIDRWDPAIADVDRFLAPLWRKGLDVWGALAPSDFHGIEMDYWPGEFSETWLYVPERTANGVFRALAAGTFFANHGHIAREVQLKLEAPGLERAAYVGESVELNEGAEVTVELSFQAAEVDWRRRPSRIDEVEIVVVSAADRFNIPLTQVPQAGRTTAATSLTVPAGGCVIFAKGRRCTEFGPDLMFYTNSIRIAARTNPSLFTTLASTLGAAETLRHPRRPGAKQACWLAFALLSLSLGIGTAVVKGPSWWTAGSELSAELTSERGTKRNWSGLPISKHLLVVVTLYLVPLCIGNSLLYGQSAVGHSQLIAFAVFICMSLATVFPAMGIVGYILGAYSATADASGPNLLLGLEFSTWIAIFNVLGLCLRSNLSDRSGPEPNKLIVGSLLLLMAWLAICVLAAVVESRPLIPGLTHRTGRFFEGLLMFLTAAGSSWRRVDFAQLAIGLAVTLCIRGSLERDELHLDGNMAMLCAMAAPLALGCVFTLTNVPMKLAAAVLSACLSVLTVYTQNRGGFLGISLAFFVFVICSRYRRWAFLMAIPLVTAFGIWFSNSELFGRFQQAYRDGEFQDSAAARIELWKAGWDMGCDHWLWGVGPENFARFCKRYNPKAETNSAHNSFIDMFAEAGVLGCLTYTLLISATILQLVRWPLHTNDYRRVHAAALLSAIAAFITVGLFLSNPSLVLAYILFGASAETTNSGNGGADEKP